MNKGLIWIGASLATINALANEQELIRENDIQINVESQKGRRFLSASKIQLNKDGSAYVFDLVGNVTYVDPKTLELIRKLNPGAPATLIGSTPCAGKSN